MAQAGLRGGKLLGQIRGNRLTFRLAGCATGLLLGACVSHRGVEREINVYPTNYKSDLLAGVHAFLNDPTGIRNAAIAEPALKPVEGEPRYVVCVRFNAKQNANTYMGDKVYAAVFVAGHFDRFAQKADEPCAGAAFAPFPELETLAR